MNFLIKLEDAINNLIEKLLCKLKALTPSFIFNLINFFKKSPALVLGNIQIFVSKLKNTLHHFLGFFTQYITLFRGKLMSVIMYVRSEEFKKTNKNELLLAPFRFAKVHPLKTASSVFTLCFLFVSLKIVFKNAETIIKGTKTLRSPASSMQEEEFFIEFKNHTFEAKMAPSSGGHGGANSEEHELKFQLDIKIEAFGKAEKSLLESMEEMLDDNLEALDLSVPQLPISPENQKKIEEDMVKSLNEDFVKMGYKAPIKSIKVKQVLGARPQYFRQIERMIKIEDINLQLFLEDTHRNRQVSIDFSALATNRNVVLYLQDHLVELKDQITSNTEPIIPQLPLEEEGRMIIKEKLKIEINEFLKKNNIEGNILEIYIDYLMAS